jgi:AraC family transcriptional regulator, regulatory protein of adaptative response / methylated-DNA-[protein]-cysteine methyltransferase
VKVINMRSESAGRFAADDQRWRAVVRRDASADGAFVYAVKTTGVYCRPSCASRRARRANVRFYETARDAERAGYRACKRCRPKEASRQEEQAAAVAKACRLIESADESPGLNELAASVGRSPSHFQRVFKSVTGVTPKAYAMANRARKTRSALAATKTVTAAIYKGGFKSNGRFYAASSKMLGMKPKAFQNGGEGAVIRFGVGQCSLGALLVAATEAGICAIALGDDPATLINELQEQFPKAELVGGDRKFEQWMAKVIGFVEHPSAGLDLPLDVQGTAFQQRVWQALCKVPCGTTTTYMQIARQIGRPDAVRAVAGAIAANKIAVAIPCHRVIRTDGSLAGYRWGVERKATLLKKEGRRMNDEG